MNKKKLKIGFVMGGGVSMGSFSSGALAYVIKNLAENLNTDIYSSCEMDVFAGASAGSVTLTATAFELCRGNYPDKLLEMLWLDKDKGLDIMTLIPGDFSLQTEPSILSTRIMKSIKKTMFEQPDLSGSEPMKSITGNEIRIGLTITNLNGIRQDASKQLIDPNYANNNYAPVHDVAKSYWHSDRRLYKVNLEKEGSDQLENQKEYRSFHHKINSGWLEMADTAQASGAFPFAFAPVKMNRFKEEYDRFWPYGETKTRDFFYADGGIMNNEPLKLAMNMAYDADLKETSDFERVFIVIDPIVGNETADLEMENATFPDVIMHTDYFKELFGFGEKFFGMLFTEVRYKDWQKTDKLNNRIQWTENFIRLMPEFVRNMTDNETIEALKTKLHKEFSSIFMLKYNATSNQETVDIQQSDIDKKLNLHMAKILEKYEAEIRSLNQQQKELFACMGALLENVSGVRKKQKVKLIGIAPTSPEVTKGDFLSAFGGFFNEKWRKFDFMVGKYQAYTILNALPDAIKITNNKLEKIHKPVNWDKPKYEDAPFEARRKFENYVYGMALNVLNMLGFWERLVVGLGFIFLKRKVAATLIKKLVNKLNSKNNVGSK